jgi:uncharacterized membrane protein YhaH (DUF805 family)
MELMFQPLRKYADFNGRARRSEFWLFALFIWVVEFVLMMLNGGMMMNAGGTPNFGIGFILLRVVGLAMFIPSLAVAFRRLHDTNRSAWWLLIGLIPFIGALVLIVFYVLDGTPGPNRFGPDPKGRDLKEAFA